MRGLAFIPALCLAGCTSFIAPVSGPQETFFERLSTLCDGQAYAGVLASNDAADADFKGADMRMGPATCCRLIDASAGPVINNDSHSY